jgi:chromosome segregation ATPase
VCSLNKPERKFVNKTAVSLAIIVALGGCAIAVWANTEASRIHQHLDQERYLRLDTEKNFQEALSMVKNFKEELTKSTGEIERMKAVLNHGEAESQQLKAEISHMTQMNAALKVRVDELEGAARENMNLKAKLNRLEERLQVSAETTATVN